MSFKEKHPGKLFVFSGPSGAGKGTICKKLLEENKELEPWTIEERIATCKEYASRLVEYYGNELAACKEMRTHASWFLKGQRNANKYKVKVCQVTSLNELYTLLDEYLESLNEESI